MSDFIISFNLFGEYDNFEVWDAAEEKERREYEKKKEKRHKEVTPEELNKLEDDKDEKTTTWTVKTLRDFLADKDVDINFESYTAPTINYILQLFYASVRSTKEGGEYSVASLRSLRAGIQCHLSGANIISDTVFKTSNAKVSPSPSLVEGVAHVRVRSSCSHSHYKPRPQLAVEPEPLQNSPWRLKR